MAGNAKALVLKIIAGCLTLTMLGLVTAVIGSADVLSDYEKKQKELDKKAQEYQSVINSTASDIAQKEEYKQALLSKISVLNEQIVSGREQIAELDKEIEDLQSEIDTSREKISGKIDMLKQRLKVIYLSGETTSLEIVLGAKTFEDFLDKIELVSYMSNSDKKMIDQLQNDIDVINKKKDSLADKKEELSEEQDKLSKRQTEMQRLIDANEKLLEGLYESNAGAQDHLDETNAERQKIEDQIKAYYADKAAQEKNAKIASEAEAKLAASRAALGSTSSGQTSSKQTVKVTVSTASETSGGTVSRIYSEKNPANTTTSRQQTAASSAAVQSRAVQPQAVSSQPAVYPTETSSEEEEPIVSYEPEPDVSSSEPEQPVISSGYEWPVPGHYTLSSVWNEDRTTYNHGAIDISDGSIMNAEVVAAESGTVVLSNSDCTHNYGKDGSCGCGGGYGNYLMIDHGNGKATLYGHLTSLNVSSGEYVQKGQVIGYVGTTGWSTGPHLHFETRLNGEKYNPMTEYPNM